MRDLYKAADEAGVVVTGGVSQTVGAGGGFVLGGGHGPLAPLHGLAADSASPFPLPPAHFLTLFLADVLEFTVVTANGTILRCSPYQYPTLFTALRGGGSAFAVVLETAFKAHTPPAGFVGIFGSFGLRGGMGASKEEGKEAWREMMKRWTALQPKLSKAGPLAGYTYVVRLPFTLYTRKRWLSKFLSQRKPEPTPFAYILPSDDIQLAKDLFTPVFEACAADPNMSIDWKFVETKSWYELWSGRAFAFSSF